MKEKKDEKEDNKSPRNKENNLWTKEDNKISLGEVHNLETK